MRGGWDRPTAGLALLALGLCLGGIATAVARSTAIRDTTVASRGAVPAQNSSLGGTPVRVRIPAIGVDADMESLGLDTDGTLEVPPYDRAGWFRGGPKPGETGPAVIAAHVDSTNGPAVFYRLKDLRTGDGITVDYDDGTAVRFVMTGADTFLKSEFPTERVYGDTRAPDLRLITCGGSFDRRAQSYVENLVVWATRSDDASSAL